MTYIALSIVAILAVIVVRRGWELKKQIIFLLSFFVLGSAIYLGAGLVSSRLPTEFGNVIYKGVGLETKTPWQEIGLYVTMIVGMAAKYLYDAIGEGNKIHFQKWQFFKPILVSPIVFAAIYGTFGENASVILLLTFAFQNGFFWQTVLSKASK